MKNHYKPCRSCGGTAVLRELAWSMESHPDGIRRVRVYVNCKGCTLTRVSYLRRERPGDVEATSWQLFY